jgi:hypothetical protein
MDNRTNSPASQDIISPSDRTPSAQGARRPIAIRPPALPKTTARLLTLLSDNPPLRTALVDAGLKAWRESNRNRVRFGWRGRRFVISQTVFRYVVYDGCGRPLVCRYH